MSAAVSNREPYENAPATLMIAVNCACCGRPLLDATSVETGMGPTCRKRHGYDKPEMAVTLADVVVIAATLPQEVFAVVVNGATTARVLANRLVHRTACADEGAPRIPYINAIRELGYHKLADALTKRICGIVIEEVDGRFQVRAPFSPSFNHAMHGIAGTRWVKNPTGKGGYRAVPVAAKAALWAALRACFAGSVARGPKGLFKIA